jgi:hypothetical protein
MAKIYALAGGSKQNPHPIVTVRMVGARTPFSTSSAQYLKGLKPYTGL